MVKSHSNRQDMSRLFANQADQECSIDVFVNDSLIPVEPQFRRTFTNGKFVNEKQFWEKNRFAYSTYYFVAFSECPMYCYK